MDCMRDGFEPGKILDGRFLSVSPLNHGSFGMVFTAEDKLTGANVAIKCITKASAVEDTTCPAAIATDDRSEELAIHSKLPTHSNIVNLVHHFESGAHQYMVLELCSNGDLYEAIRSGHGPLETEHVREMMLQLVDVIDHCHSNGVYHRDIKPENIFLAADGTMKLGDFGLATTETWSTEFAVGSDRYMAPEQYDSSVYGYGYSPAAADTWAIGIVLLNVLFQKNPFTSPTPQDLIFADFMHDRESLFDAFPKMSQDTYNVLVHSLALDPANRSLPAVREALIAVNNFTTDDETLDEFCTEQNDVITTGAREPLRTPSISSPAMNGDSFPWTSALLKTPQKPERQLSTIQDEELELFPGTVKSEWQYVDADEASLSSAFDSGLGMSYKSTKSVKSVQSSEAKSGFGVGSLPISFNRPANKSPYGAKGSGFSKSWSDLYEEDLELEEQGRSSFDSEPDLGMDMDRVDTVKPSTPQLRSISEDEQGSVTPRPIHAVAATDATTRSMSPLRKLVEHDKANPASPKQRSGFVMDRWAALGNFRRAPSTPTAQKTKYSDAFSNFTSFTSFSSKKQKAANETRDRSLSWRQGSPTRLRSTSVNKSQVWERPKEHSPTHPPVGVWALDNDWRQHKPPVTRQASPPTTGLAVIAHNIAPRKHAKNFFDIEMEHYDGYDVDIEWVDGWRNDS